MLGSCCITHLGNLHVKMANSAVSLAKFCKTQKLCSPLHSFQKIHQNSTYSAAYIPTFCRKFVQILQIVFFSAPSSSKTSFCYFCPSILDSTSSMLITKFCGKGSVLRFRLISLSRKFPRSQYCNSNLLSLPYRTFV